MRIQTWGNGKREGGGIPGQKKHAYRLILEACASSVKDTSECHLTAGAVTGGFCGMGDSMAFPYLVLSLQRIVETVME